MVQAHLQPTTRLNPNHSLPSLRASGRRLFLCPLRIERHARDSRAVQCVRHARVSRIPGHYGPREHLTLQIRALHVRIHTLTLKFLQGHT